MGVEAEWNQLHKIILSSASDVLGFSTRKCQDWFDENDSQIMQAFYSLHMTHKTWFSDTTSTTKKAVYHSFKPFYQSKMHIKRDDWWKPSAENIQPAAAQTDNKHFYNQLKMAAGPISHSSIPTRSADGTILLHRRESYHRSLG